MTSPRNLLWVGGPPTITEGKPHWPAYLTLSLNERDAWELMRLLAARLRDRSCNRDHTNTTIEVFVGGGNLDPDET